MKKFSKLLGAMQLASLLGGFGLTIPGYKAPPEPKTRDPETEAKAETKRQRKAAKFTRDYQRSLEMNPCRRT